MFDGDPDCVGAAPGRVNIMGGHTDYNDGFVLPVAIDRHTVVAGRRRPDETVVVHSQTPDEKAEFQLSTLELAVGAVVRETVDRVFRNAVVQHTKRREFITEYVECCVRDCFVGLDGRVERSGANLLPELEEPVDFRTIEVVETLLIVFDINRHTELCEQGPDVSDTRFLPGMDTPKELEDCSVVRIVVEIVATVVWNICCFEC